MSGSLTIREAAQRLGVSNTKIWRLVKDGRLPTERNPLDGRQRLVRTADLEKLEVHSSKLPHFVSDGIVNVPSAPHADELEEYLGKHWLILDRRDFDVVARSEGSITVVS